MRWYATMFSLIGLYTVILFTGIAHASSHRSAQSCASVRCASGTCVETPQGPVCQPQLSCANVLCKQGYTCREALGGPSCVRGISKPAARPIYGKPSQAGQNKCYTVRDYYLGQSYYRTICPGERLKPVRKHHYQTWPRYGERFREPPRSNPAPRPEETLFCPQIYAPVCAEKQVQCVKAPCPPVRRSFGNSCEAGVEGYTVIRNGRCEDGGQP